MCEFDKLWLLLATTCLFTRVTGVETTGDILGSGEAEAAVGTWEAIDIFQDGSEWDTSICTSSTCGPNGRCYMTTFGFVCKCDAGYVGERCDSHAFAAVQCDADYCNGGTCTVLKSGIDYFFCTCEPRFAGRRCETCAPGFTGEGCRTSSSRPDPCDPNPCPNGVCVYVERGFRCDIVPAASISNPCAVNPCLNGGTCNVPVSRLNSFTCTCARGFVGVTCQTPSKSVSLPRPSPCLSNPCPTGLCVDIGGGIHECRVRIGRPHRGPCDINPCMNGGICTVDSMTFQCNCKRGWDGHRCDRRSRSTDVCAYKPCKNGGRCSAVNGSNSFICTCAPGYAGSRCGTLTDPCGDDQCHNGGACKPFRGSNSFICTCAHGYAGKRCEIRTDPCAGKPCHNGGTCQPVSGYNTFKCTCAPGYTGGRCGTLTATDPCAGNPCQNGATCNPAPGQVFRANPYNCTCVLGFEGEKCERETTALCPSNICKNEALCVISGAVIRCICKSGYGGHLCEIPLISQVDHCNPNPCMNRGHCSPHLSFGTYTCTCVPGYEGETCEIETITLCPSNPCKNEALCVISGGVSQCLCNSGYGGSLCEIEPILQIDQCNPNPCKNHGLCRPYLSLFTCTCISEWTGPTCETYSRTSDPSVLPSEATTRVCDPNPCKGGCSCYPSCRHELGYYCRGENGFLGKNCDIPAPEVDCGADTVTISVDDRVVAEYGGVMDTSTIFMDRGSSMLPTLSCPATRRGSNFIITLSFPFTACGAVVSTGSSGKTIVSNKVWMNRLIGGPKADMPIPLVHFICEYGLQYSVVTSLTPSVSRPPTINNTVEGSANIELCKTSDCPALCPQVYSMTKGAVYTVGQTIHLRFTASIQGIDIRLLNLFLSCDSDSNTAAKSAAVVLAANGCLPDRDRRYLPTEVRPEGDSNCASFPVPMLTACSEFYIHALLNPCTTDCLAPYKSCARKSKRSNSEALNGANANSPPFQVFGPITVIQGEHGVALLLEFNENGTDVDVVPIQKPEKEIISEDSISPPLYIALGILFAVAVTMFAVLFALNWRHINAHCGRKL